MKKIVYLFLILSLSSCMKMVDRIVEDARENIRVESIEKIATTDLTNVDIVLKIANNSKYKLALDDATLTLFYGQSRVGDIMLREGVEVPKRATTSVLMQWRLKINNPLTLFAASRELRSRNLDNMYVSFKIAGKGGPAPIDFSEDMMSLSQFLAIFGASIDDLDKINK